MSALMETSCWCAAGIHCIHVIQASCMKGASGMHAVQPADCNCLMGVRRRHTPAAIAQVLFLFGMFIFAVLIGFIGDEIKHQASCSETAGGLARMTVTSCRTACRNVLAPSFTNHLCIVVATTTRSKLSLLDTCPAAGQFKLVRAGNTEVHLQSHILVLNWNALLVPLLRQLTAASSDRQHAFHKRPVVILADRCVGNSLAVMSRLQQYTPHI